VTGLEHSIKQYGKTQVEEDEEEIRKKQEAPGRYDRAST
jgi:hypothetical protein